MTVETSPTTESDELFRLYSKRILALTTDLACTGRLQDAEASASCRSPLCGSTVTVDVRMKDGRISEYGHDVKACALGQASAAVLYKQALGLSRNDIATARDQLAAMLKEGGPPPEGNFSELEALLPARDFKNRHASILLAYEAAITACDQLD